MKINNSLKTCYAVSEVIGSLFLIVMAVVSFSVIRFYAFPDLSEPNEKIELQGYVTKDGYAVIDHLGGKSISNCRVIINDKYGTLINSTEYKNINWSIGHSLYPFQKMNYTPLLNETDEVEISVYNLEDEGTEQLIFTGVFLRPTPPYDPHSPILISSLRTDSPDEDLICYSYPIIPKIIPKSYIYHWTVNGISLEDLNMPFDTKNNQSFKDYSGNNLNGTSVGAIWTNQGIVGGAYYFGGSSEYATINLPPVFYDMTNNDFSISVWVKVMDITRPHSVILMAVNAKAQGKNFAEIFLTGNQINFGLISNYNDIKVAEGTDPILNNTWYHIVGVWHAAEKKITLYSNGVICNSGYRNYALGEGNNNQLVLGHAGPSSQFLKGYIDELVVYNRALSPSQPYQIYLSTKDGNYDRRVFTCDETKLGEAWQCLVTPNDSIKDDITLFSNIVKIKNYPGVH